MALNLYDKGARQCWQQKRKRGRYNRQGTVGDTEMAQYLYDDLVGSSEAGLGIILCNKRENSNYR